MKNNLVYIGMCADLIHHGHLNIIKQARKYGKVVIGLLTDSAIASYKRLPALSYEERKIVVENIVGVNEVIPQDTLDYIPNLEKIKPNYVVHGDDWKEGVQKQVRRNVLNKLKFGSIAQNFSVDKTIQGSTTAAKAYVDKFDSNYVWYHQTDSTGYILFQEGETVTELDGNGEGILDSAANDPDTDAFTKSTIKPFSGTLLYVDNRAAIERDPNQTEDIKVIIQL